MKITKKKLYFSCGCFILTFIVEIFLAHCIGLKFLGKQEWSQILKDLWQYLILSVIITIIIVLKKD